MVLNTEWALSHKVLRRVWATFFKLMVDLFATRFSKRLPLYVSPVPDPQVWEIDALSIPWLGLEAYAFPPFPIISRVLKKARIDQPHLLLILPKWPAQPWYPELLGLSQCPPLPLCLTEGDLVQPRSGIPHGNVASLDLHVWELFGNPSHH